MGRVFDEIKRFFDQDDWKYEVMEERPIIRLGFSGKNGSFNCFAQAREQQEQFVFYAMSAINAPEEKRTAIAEFLTRANYGMILGNFEMDFNDGEIRYKTSIDVEGEELTFHLAKQVVYANVMTMDRYFPGIMKVLYSDIAPADAVKEIENPS